MYFGAAKVSTTHPLGRDRMCVQQWAMGSKYEEILPVTSHSQNHKTSTTYFYILWPQDDLDIDHCRLIILIWPASSGNELTKPSTPLYFMLEPPETALFCKSLNCRAWLRLKWAHWQWASKMPGRGQFADLAILDHKGNQSTQLTRSMSQCPCKNFDAAGHSHPSTQIPSAPLKKCDRTFLESTFVFSCSFPRQRVRGL